MVHDHEGLGELSQCMGPSYILGLEGGEGGEYPSLGLIAHMQLVLITVMPLISQNSIFSRAHATAWHPSVWSPLHETKYSSSYMEVLPSSKGDCLGSMGMMRLAHAGSTSVPYAVDRHKSILCSIILISNSPKSANYACHMQ